MSFDLEAFNRALGALASLIPAADESRRKLVTAMQDLDTRRDKVVEGVRKSVEDHHTDQQGLLSRIENLEKNIEATLARVEEELKAQVGAENTRLGKVAQTLEANAAKMSDEATKQRQSWTEMNTNVQALRTEVEKVAKAQEEAAAVPEMTRNHAERLEPIETWVKQCPPALDTIGIRMGELDAKVTALASRIPAADDAAAPPAPPVPDGT